jgi:spermidine synthase
VTLVDLDPAMTGLAKVFPPLAQLNRNSFEDKRVRVVNDDAMVWIDQNRDLWDVIIIDFPDPNTYALAKLYTKLFYSMVNARLAPGGAIGLQATSPLFARRAYWCIIETMRAGGLVVMPYQVTVPSFGVWGFALAKKAAFEPPTKVPNVALKYLNDESLAALFVMSADMQPVPAEINHLDNQVLVRYYEREWKRWQQ